jgi:hypothetical protein
VVPPDAPLQELGHALALACKLLPDSGEPSRACDLFTRTAHAVAVSAPSDLVALLVGALTAKSDGHLPPAVLNEACGMFLSSIAAGCPVSDLAEIPPVLSVALALEECRPKASALAEALTRAASDTLAVENDPLKRRELVTILRDLVAAQCARPPGDQGAVAAISSTADLYFIGLNRLDTVDDIVANLVQVSSVGARLPASASSFSARVFEQLLRLMAHCHRSGYHVAGKAASRIGATLAWTKNVGDPPCATLSSSDIARCLQGATQMVSAITGSRAKTLEMVSACRGWLEFSRSFSGADCPVDAVNQLTGAVHTLQTICGDRLVRAVVGDGNTTDRHAAFTPDELVSAAVHASFAVSNAHRAGVRSDLAWRALLEKVNVAAAAVSSNPNVAVDLRSRLCNAAAVVFTAPAADTLQPTDQAVLYSAGLLAIGSMDALTDGGSKWKRLASIARFFRNTDTSVPLKEILNAAIDEVARDGSSVLVAPLAEVALLAVDCEADAARCGPVLKALTSSLVREPSVFGECAASALRTYLRSSTELSEGQNPVDQRADAIRIGETLRTEHLDAREGLAREQLGRLAISWARTVQDPVPVRTVACLALCLSPSVDDKSSTLDDADLIRKVLRAMLDRVTTHRSRFELAVTSGLTVRAFEADSTVDKSACSTAVEAAVKLAAAAVDHTVKVHRRRDLVGYASRHVLGATTLAMRGAVVTNSADDAIAAHGLLKAAAVLAQTPSHELVELHHVVLVARIVYSYAMLASRTTAPSQRFDVAAFQDAKRRASAVDFTPRFHAIRSALANLHRGEGRVAADARPPDDELTERVAVDVLKASTVAAIERPEPPDVLSAVALLATYADAVGQRKWREREPSDVEELRRIIVRTAFPLLAARLDAEHET